MLFEVTLQLPWATRESLSKQSLKVVLQKHQPFEDQLQIWLLQTGLCPIEELVQAEKDWLKKHVFECDGHKLQSLEEVKPGDVI